MATNYKVLDGTDLLLSVGGKALGYSTSCKISTSTETGERITKEILNYIEYAKAKGCSMTGPEDPEIEHLNVLR